MSAAHTIVDAVDEASVEELFESKLQPPLARSLVSRGALIDRLDGAEVPITVVEAPPGYGKSTLLAEWASRRPGHFAWLSIDRHDNDRGRLVAYLGAALNRVEPVGAELQRPTAGRGSVTAVASRVAAAISAMSAPVVLALDHVEALQNDDCLDTIAELALHLPAGSRLVLATRAEPPLPMPRLRASGTVVEVGVGDLAMTKPEASALFEAAGVDLDEMEMDGVLERTEGWPVGLYLAALAMKAGGARENAGVRFSGDDRLMADYLRAELLSRLSDAEVTFLTRTSILDRMSAELCDAMLRDAGSGAVLESLARSNVLLVALDRRGEWYRYHHLFRDLLRAELHSREPELVPALHLRAADWCEGHRLYEVAIDHAQAGVDPERVNRLMLTNAPRAYASGRAQTVLRWFTWLEAEELIEPYPAVAALGALFFNATGEPAAAERWAVASEHAGRTGVHPDLVSPERMLPDGSTLGGWRALLRALQCRDGVAAMRRDAEIAVNGLSASGGLRTGALNLVGLTYLLEGDAEHADPIFALAVDGGRGAPNPSLVIALTNRGFCALSRGDWPAVEAFASEALAVVERLGVGDYEESASTLVLAARLALHRGDGDQARHYVTRTARLRPLLTYLRPAVTVHTLLELARTYAMLGDIAGAREVLRQARDILHMRPDLGVLPAEVRELESKLDTLRAGKVGASSLTAAELRLVPFLPTHLTFPQIGARLHISRNTAKTQAISIYQKLGVSSRGEAIERLQELGLLDA